MHISRYHQAIKLTVILKYFFLLFTNNLTASA